MEQHKIGSFQWTVQNQGKLSFKEKVKLINKIILPSFITPIKANLNLNPWKKDSDFNLDLIIVPDTPMIKLAVEELESKADLALINHSWRTYFWGATLGHIQHHHYDPESLLTASLFHDIGFTEAHIHSKGCKCFTQESADQFQIKAQEIQFDAVKTEIIKDAICLHMNGYSDDSYSNEAKLLQQGASCDVIGDQIYKVPKHLKNSVLTQYPRENFNKRMIENIKMESKLNPNSRTALFDKLGLPLLIHLNPFKE